MGRQPIGPSGSLGGWRASRPLAVAALPTRGGTRSEATCPGNCKPRITYCKAYITLLAGERRGPPGVQRCSNAWEVCPGLLRVRRPLAQDRRQRPRRRCPPCSTRRPRHPDRDCGSNASSRGSTSARSSPRCSIRHPSSSRTSGQSTQKGRSSNALARLATRMPGPAGGSEGHPAGGSLPRKPKQRARTSSGCLLTSVGFLPLRVLGVTASRRCHRNGPTTTLPAVMPAVRARIASHSPPELTPRRPSPWRPPAW